VGSGLSRSSHAIAPGARIRGKVERHEKFGVIVFLGPGKSGLIPLSETGLGRDADVAKTLPVGSEVDVVVLEADELNRRVRLSIKAIADAAEAEELREYRSREETAPAEGFGSLADKLRGALGPRNT
jgi:general stress protein 13